MSEDGTPVTLYIYDLSKGLAPAISPFLIGEVVEGIWHTSIVIYGKEHFFGSDGISICDPGGTVLGEPQRTVDLGVTYIPRAVFDDYLEGLRSSTFKGDQYKLLKHNCNNFSNELSQFLVGQKIPQYILDLPEHILAKLSGFFRLSS
ncbi:desumoylating isopeptidase 1-like isoform X2 [Nilaparvata lugens]|uniref:desumoylating isopeptidase 1-like isoform X2 n=1 Tax=Nilaparvata lugens TaxID=108931 RepID=UPI00193DCFD1|nr:desumoylating isopeptidase 1-like isoform X2 [Nilaparvata lugens]XP_039300874.1 desumoylating isopeptidase 1-like isoform X2 [Nilaparvata lugens]